MSAGISTAEIDTGLVRVSEHADHPGLGQQLGQQLKLLRV